MASCSGGASASSGKRKPPALNIELPHEVEDGPLELTNIPHCLTTFVDKARHGQWQLTNLVTGEIHMLGPAHLWFLQFFGSAGDAESYVQEQAECGGYGRKYLLDDLFKVVAKKHKSGEMFLSRLVMQTSHRALCLCRQSIQVLKSLCSQALLLQHMP